MPVTSAIAFLSGCRLSVKQSRHLSLLARVLFAPLLVTGALPARAQEFYGGKQISFIVGAASGGGYDLLARLVSRHLGKHIPGAPAIIVQNLPAGGSIVAANLLANTLPRDGTAIGLMQRGVLLAGLTGIAQVQYDVGKFNWLASLNSEVAITFSTASSAHKTARDLFEKELIVGGVVNVDPETTARLYNDLLGTKFKLVNGYLGTNDVGLAIERGEVSGIADWSWSSLNLQRPDWVRDKKINILLQGSLERVAELAQVPSAFDFVKGPLEKQVLELYFTQKTVARPVIAPPGVPAGRLDVLRRAFASLVNDKEFLADADRSKLEVNLLDGAAVDKVIALITGVSEDVRERYNKATK